jgi:hypothetical protein
MGIIALTNTIKATVRVARQGRGEATERLRDEHDAARFMVADRAHNGLGILAQTSGVVCGRKSDGHGSVPAVLEPWRHQVPVPGTAACTRHENEGERRHVGSYAPRSPLPDRRTKSRPVLLA